MSLRIQSVPGERLAATVLASGSAEREGHGAEGGSGAPCLVLLHGILGRGTNLGALARRLGELLAEAKVWLVDLPAHGDSRPWPPPYTLRAAAKALERTLQASPGCRPVCVAGHSLGGKVALQWLALTSRPPRALWVLDAHPGRRSASHPSLRPLLSLLQRLEGASQRSFPTRSAFARWLASQGVPPMVAQWLGTTLQPAEDGYRFATPLHAARALLDDHLRTDLWDVLEAPPEGTVVHVVAAERSGVFEPEDLQRLEALERSSGRLRLHRLPTGHWVHVEALEALAARIAESLRA